MKTEFDHSFEKTWRIKSPSCIFCDSYRRSGNKKLFGYCRRLGVPLFLDMAQICRAYSTIDIVQVVGSISDPPEGHKVTKELYAYNADENLETIKYYEGSELLFTLTYDYNEQKNLKSKIRS